MVSSIIILGVTYRPNMSIDGCVTLEPGLEGQKLCHVYTTAVLQGRNMDTLDTWNAARSHQTSAVTESIASVRLVEPPLGPKKR